MATRTMCERGSSLLLGNARRNTPHPPQCVNLFLAFLNLISVTLQASIYLLEQLDVSFYYYYLSRTRLADPLPVPLSATCKYLWEARSLQVDSLC